MLPRWILLLAPLAGWGLGCGTSPPGEMCTNDDSPNIPGAPDTALRRARITVEQRLTRDATGDKRESSASGSLVDVSAVVTRPRSPTPVGSLACYGLTGAPSTTCREGFKEPCTQEPLDADKVHIEGLAGGGKDMVKGTRGIYTLEALPDPPFVSGVELVASVTGRNDKGFYPSLDLKIKAPDPLEVTSPVVGPTPLGGSDLKIRWKRGNGDFIVIDVADATGKTTDKIQCIVLDDGCHTILASDLDLYDMKVGGKIRLSVARNIDAVRTTPTSDVSLEVKGVSRVELTLSR